MTLSIRARLTLWYTTVLTLVLAASATGFYVVQWRQRLTQLDEDLARTEALVARLLPIELDEGLTLAEASSGALEDLDLRDRPLAVFDAAGVRLSGAWEGLPLDEGKRAGEPDGVTTVNTSAGRFRLYRTRLRHRGIAYQIGAARPLATVDLELARLRSALLSGGLFALLLAGGGGFWIARQGLRPVALMAAQARGITDRTPSARLAVPNPQDELGLLAGAFNELLARLESALSSQRRFMADASHELRTPVSIARTASEVMLSHRGRSEEEYRDSLGVVAAQTRRLARMVEEMFTLARADAAGLPLERGPLYLDELVGDCVKEARVLATAGDVLLDWQGPDDLEALGDERLLRQMLMNLLDNAVRHARAGGAVRVTLSAQTDGAEIAVTDSGGGIPEAERERVFERFVRLDAQHGVSEGAGLGLPIARAIAEAHEGTLELARSGPSGSTFLIRLPGPKRRA